MSKKEQIEKYIKDVFGRGKAIYSEDSITIYGNFDMKMSHLKDLSKILKLKDLNLSVKRDYEDNLKTDITWENKKAEHDCNCADWGMMNHLSDCPAKNYEY